jgi:hypothetical protein
VIDINCMNISKLTQKRHTGIRPNTRKGPVFTTGINHNAWKEPIFTTGIKVDTRKIPVFTTTLAGFTGVNVELPVTNRYKTKNPMNISSQGSYKIGHRPTLPRFTAVPSALAGLTSLFGMGRGRHRRYRHLKILMFE